MAADDLFGGRLTSLCFRDADIQASQELPASAQESDAAEIAADEALNMQRSNAAVADGFEVPEVSSDQYFPSPNASIARTCQPQMHVANCKCWILQMQGAASPRFDSDDADGESWDQYGYAVPADYFQTSNAGKAPLWS